MENKRILALIKKKIGIIVLVGFLVSAFSFLILVLKEKNYKVTTDYLIVQNQTGNQDFYTVSKSAEYIGKVLSEATYSELFINEVIKTGKVNPEFLPFDKKERMREWGKDIQSSVNPDLGIITLVVFDNNQNQALAISNAASDVLTTKNSLFRGDGQNIQVKVLSGPVIERNPSIANIIATVIGGFILGIMLFVLWLVFKEDHRQRNVFSHSTQNTVSQPVANLQNNLAPIERMKSSGNFLSDEEKQEVLGYLNRS